MLDGDDGKVQLGKGAQGVGCIRVSLSDPGF